MSLSAAVLDALLASGCTAEQIVAAVKADLVGSESRITDKRAKDAERQRQSRSNRRGHNVSRNVTVTECDPPIDNTHTPTLIPIEPNGSIAPRGRKPKSNRRLPDDWQPEPLTAETANMVQLWEVGRLERELSKFKDYWKGASGRRASKDDWQAAWRFWLANADEWKPKNAKFSDKHDAMGVTERAAHRALSEITGGTGRFEGSGDQIPPANASGSYRTIDAVPDAMRSIGYAGG